MKRERKGKEKYPLLFATIVAFLAVCTTGVSTFAWFQATAAVSIQPTSTGTTITVNKPEDFSFWAYRGNGVDGYTPSSPEKFEYDGESGDFEQISSGSPKTSLTGMGPGQRMLFAVKFNDVTSMSFDVKSIISNDSAKQSTTKRKVAGSSPDILINIGWAINIYSKDSYTGAGYTDFMASPGTDQFQVSDGSDVKSWSVSSGTSENPEITYSSGSYKNIFTKSDETLRSTFYVFYMIEYSDDSDTWYKEVKSDDARAEELELPTSGASARWFVKSSAKGNSNCYAGLDFAIKEIVVTKNGQVVGQE